jgi:hypothetical protein
MDEKGFLIGILSKTQRIFTREAQEKGKLLGAGQDGNRSWITCLATICMDGTTVPPVLIYQATTGNIQNSWLDELDPHEPDAAHFASTPSGWTNDEMALAWMKDVFDRYTKPKCRDGRAWRLLFIDGHGSHVNLRFLNWCVDNKILIAIYPPHSTHRLQPLDVSMFGPLGIFYSQELNDWLHGCGGLCQLTKRDFYGLFRAAYKRAFTEKNIESAWRRTGLQPLDPEVVLSQISKTTTERPATSHSISSTSTVYSASRIREVRRLVKRVVGEGSCHVTPSSWVTLLKRSLRRTASLLLEYKAFRRQ